MNTNTMELNPNVTELNLNELELISGGRWSWKNAIIGGVIGGVSLGMLGQCLGGLPGDHTAIFGNDGETLSITHHAISRSVFAIGAVKAAQFALTQEKGFFTFADVVRAAK